MRLNVNKARRATQRATVVLGDVNAAQRGRLPQRVANRLIGRGVARVLRGKWL